MAELRVDIERLEQDHHSLVNTLQEMKERLEKNKDNTIQLAQWNGPASQAWKQIFDYTHEGFLANIKKAKQAAEKMEVALYFYKQAEEAIRSSLNSVQ